METLSSLSLSQVNHGLNEKQFSSVDVVASCLERIKHVDTSLHAFLFYDEKAVLESATKADEKRKNGTNLPLLGIPIAIKDNFCTIDLPTTAASNVLEKFVPAYNATVVDKLTDAGAIVLGKTNLDAWAHGSSTETSDFGVTKNPWDTTRLPGGSSGGSAAAVAAHETIAAIGSETAGSIRQPASWCGIVGVKPTYGRVSRYGVVAMASSFDCPGPMTKTVKDSAMLLEILAGNDKKDATTSPLPVPAYTKSLTTSIKGKRIGISRQYFENIDDQVKQAVNNALDVLTRLGAQIIPLDLFDPKYAMSVYTILQRSEVSSNLARFDGIRYGNNRDLFGLEAKRRILLGTYTLSAGYYDKYYHKAQQVRTLIINDFAKAFTNVDVILAPTSPTLPLPIGATNDQSMFGETADLLVEPSSIAGIPGINIPCGMSNNTLPIGMQLMGNYFQEEILFNVAYQYEQATQQDAWRKETITI